MVLRTGSVDSQRGIAENIGEVKFLNKIKKKKNSSKKNIKMAMLNWKENLNEEKLSQASKVTVQNINRILYGKTMPENRYRMTVREFEGLDVNRIAEAEEMLQNLDSPTLIELSEIFNLTILEQENATHEVLAFLLKFGETEPQQQLGDTESNESDKQLPKSTDPKQIDSLEQQLQPLLENTQSSEIIEEQQSAFMYQQNLALRRQAEQQNEMMYEMKQQIQELKMKLQNNETQWASSSSNPISTQPTIKHRIIDDCGEQNSSKTTNQQSVHVNSTLNMKQFVKANCSVQNSSVNSVNSNSTIEKLMRRQILGADLPMFNGNPLEWPAFITEYNRSTVDCEFTASENAQRLRKCLMGSARQCVDMLLYTSEAVRIIEVLRRNFGNPETIVDLLMNKIDETPNVTSSKSFSAFANLCENLQVILLNFDTDNSRVNDKRLVKRLIQKLPDYLRIQCASYLFTKGVESPNVNHVSIWANSQHQIVSLFEIGEPIKQIAIQSARTEARTDVKTSLNEWLPKKEKASIPDNKFNNQNVKNSSTVECKICKTGDHPITKCAKFLAMDISKRWKAANSIHACFTCLKKHHGMCNPRIPCGVMGCGRFHHQLLHKTDIHRTDNSKPEIGATATVMSSKSDGVILKMVPVRLRGPSGEIDIVAFMDEGSTTTMIDSEVAKKIGATGPVKPLCCMWTGGISRNDDSSQQVSFDLFKKSNDTPYTLKNVRTFQSLQLPQQRIDVDELHKLYPYTKQADVRNEQAKLLIGQDNCDLIVSRENIQLELNAPMLTLTKIGWTIHGPAKGVTMESEKIVSANICCEKSLDDLNDLVKKQMSLENFGVVATSTDRQKSEDDRKAVELAESTIKNIGSRYEIGLPFVNREDKFVESYTTAFHRLQCTERKISKDHIVDGYQQTIDSYLQKGYAEKVEPEKIAVERQRMWYLPHFPVVNINKPGKLRLVFDAAAKSHNFCLNDYLLTGPDLVPSLFGILARFREENIGICADITEMFPQVRIKDEDSWAQCFLWRNMEKHRVPDIYKMNRMIFGATSSPFLAQFVKNNNAEMFRESFPEAAEAIVRQHYVDDFIESVESEHQAKKLISEVIAIQQKAGFELRGFISNVPSVLENLPTDILAKDTTIHFETIESHRVLGVRWNASDDSFVFHYDFLQMPKRVIDGTQTPTKREVLKIAMSVFDPIGFLSPITISSRTLLQQLWKSGVGWDDEISSDLSKKWVCWLKLLETLDNLNIRRCYLRKGGKYGNIQLHTFCDASESAYSAVCYLRVESINVEIAFVASKARVAPIKVITIPKLELLAAVLGVRLAQLVKNELRLNIDEEKYWSDSRTVLAWIRTNKKLPTFIATRVGEIIDNTKSSDWNWVPSKLNPADKATRDNTENLDSSSMWFTGPEFLSKSVNEWPKQKIEDTTIADAETEVVKLGEIVGINVELSLLADNLPDPEKFQRLARLIKATAYIRKWRSKIQQQFNTTIGLQPKDIEWAYHQWYKSVQEEFPKDFVRGLRQMAPYEDEDGILRAGGRIGNAKFLHNDTRHPIILNGKHRFVKLLILYYHGKAMHQGRETVLHCLKQKYYFPKMRAFVKRYINECQVCIVYRSQPKPQLMGIIPEVRLTPNLPCFTFTGLDYFGPILVRVGRSNEKRWGVIFTCMVSRAVHIEVAASLTTDSAIMAVRRFQARRGIPKKIFCDNGTNFHGAANEIQRNIEYEEIQQRMVMDGTSWVFIPPASPHFGGCWERMIRTVKIALSAVLNEKIPKDETLHTFLVEIENLINSRPITFVSDDPEDAQSLTPNMLLKGRQESIIIHGHFERRDELLRKQWRISQLWAQEFWNRWQKEYVTQLLPRQKWLVETNNLKVGDVVKIQNEQCARGEWPIGKIVQVHPGEDGRVRVVSVKTGNGGIIKRPTSKLAPIVFMEGNESVTCIDH